MRRQTTLADPLIDLRDLRAPAIQRGARDFYGLSSFVTLGVFVFTSQYLQLVLGLSPLRAGLCMAPFARAFIAGSLLTPAIARRVRPALVIAAGPSSPPRVSRLPAQLRVDSTVALFIAGEIVYSLGLAPVFTLANDLIIGTAPSDCVGAAAALSETGSELGGALGIAILGSIGALAYRRELARAAGADVVPAARDTLGAALQIAQSLPWRRTRRWPAQPARHLLLRSASCAAWRPSSRSGSRSSPCSFSKARLRMWRRWSVARSLPCSHRRRRRFPVR